MQNLNFSCASPTGARLPVHFSLAAIACAVFTHTAMAQEAALQETVVTATRTESRLDATLADVTVITRAQLDAVGPGRSVAEVLQRLAGVQLSSNGGRGQAQSIFLRGAAATTACCWSMACATARPTRQRRCWPTCRWS